MLDWAQDYSSGPCRRKLDSVVRVTISSLTSETFVGTFHHGMARPQVADGGPATDMEGSCE